MTKQWIVDDIFMPTDDEDRADVIIRSSETQRAIATVHSISGHPDLDANINKEEELYNANLMAAAPLMYDILNKFLIGLIGTTISDETLKDAAKQAIVLKNKMKELEP